MKTLVAPTDFSSLSVNAVHYAAALALQIGAVLQVIHVVEIPVIVSPGPYPAIAFGELEKEAMDKLAALKKGLDSSIKAGLSVQLKIKLGIVTHELEELQRNKDICGIVMATHGKHGLERFFVGSDTLNAVHRLRVPVLIVPENMLFTPIKRIALATGLFNKPDDQTLDFIREWLQATNAQLDLLHVDSVKQPEKNFVPEAVELQHQLAAFRPQFYFLINEEVEAGINEFIEKNNIDLLIILPQKHGVINRLLFKNSSEHIILHPTIPVMAIKAHNPD